MEPERLLSNCRFATQGFRNKSNKAHNSNRPIAQLVLDTIENSSAERVHLFPIYCRYISQRYLYSQSQYIAKIFVKGIFQDVENI